MDVNDMIHDEDLVIHKAPYSNGDGRGPGGVHPHAGAKQEVQDIVAKMVPGHLSRTLSAREKNLLKRKAKGIVKEGSKDWQEDDDAEEPTPKRMKNTKAVITEQPHAGDKVSVGHLAFSQLKLLEFCVPFDSRSSCTEGNECNELKGVAFYFLSANA